MKKLLFRKLLIDCLTFFLITLLSASVIIWVFQAVNFLDIMIEDGRSYKVYINYSLLNFPKIVSKVLPFTFFFSFFYVITRYEINNELIIFWNFGINKLQLINFLFIFSIFLTLIQIILSTFIVPTTQDLARSFLRSSSVNFLESFIKQKKFNDTIRYNIAYSKPNSSVKEIIDAAKLSSIDKFISNLELGYETLVGERGLKLSGGEKQRVAIARALLKKPKIFVFDEATSALDTKTEKSIERSLKKLSSTNTTLVIAHRLSTIIDADKIIVLENGRIIEIGTHQELIKNNNLYTEMWVRQQENQN